MSKTLKRKKGDTGEGIAARFLMKQGFRIIERNYNKPWGEIDLIAKKGNLLCFIEVKTVSCGTNRIVSYETSNLVSHLQSENKEILRQPKISLFSHIGSFVRNKYLQGVDSYVISEVSRDTLNNISHETGYRPEDNLHPWKLGRIKRTIQTYLKEKGIDEESDWRFDATCVYLNEKDKKAEVKWLEDIIL